MNPEPPLLIIAPLANTLDLTQVPWCDAAKDKISVNRDKFQNMEMAEVIVDAMPFLLTRLSATETSQIFNSGKYDQLLCALPPATHSAIGVAPGDNLASARHLSEINRRLLLLGQWIGESLGATTAAWMPSRRLTSFAWFDQAVRRYLADDRIPFLFQTAVAEVRSGCFVTSGLHYFAGQELRLTTAEGYDLAAATRHLVQIIYNMIAYGKIISPARSVGSHQNEALIFTPSEDLGHVDVRISNDAHDADLAKI